MREGWPVAEACQRLEAAGADVVGLNCHRGPRTMLPLLQRDPASRQRATWPPCPCPTARPRSEPTFNSLRDPSLRRHPRRARLPHGARSVHLHPLRDRRLRARGLRRWASATWASAAAPRPHHIRAMAEALGRTPPASRYTADMSKHAFLGTDPSLPQENLEFAKRL